MRKSLLVFHCNYVNFIPFLRQSASNSGMTLKYGLKIIQGHWKWHNSILVCHCKHNTTDIQEDVPRFATS